MTAIYLFLAYVLPLPLTAACFYFHLYEGMPPAQRALAIAVTALAPSAVLMVVVLKRIIHLLFYIALVVGAVYGLQYLGFVKL